MKTTAAFLLASTLMVALPSFAQTPPAGTDGEGETRKLVDVLKGARTKLLDVPVAQNRSRLAVLDEFLAKEEERLENLNSRRRGHDIAIGRAREALAGAGEDPAAWARALETLDSLVQARMDTEREAKAAEAAVDRLRRQRAVVSRKVGDYERIRTLVIGGEDPPDISLDPSVLLDVPVLPDSAPDDRSNQGIDTDVALALREFAVQTGHPAWRERWIEQLRTRSPKTYARWLARNDQESFLALRRIHEVEFRATLREVDPGRYALLYGAKAGGPGGPPVDEKSFLRPE